MKKFHVKNKERVRACEQQREQARERQIIWGYTIWERVLSVLVVSYIVLNYVLHYTQFLQDTKCREVTLYTGDIDDCNSCVPQTFSLGERPLQQTGSHMN